MEHQLTQIKKIQVGFIFYPDCNSSTNPSLQNNFNITLTVTDSYGCTNTDLETTTVFCQPEADFTAAEVCEGDTTFFYNNSSPQFNMNFMWGFWRWI